MDHDEQTESHTQLAPQEAAPGYIDRDLDIFTKARALGELTFTLRAIDITADLLIDLWVAFQQEITEDLKQGMTVQESVDSIRWDINDRLRQISLPMPRTGDARLDEALDKAEAMRQQPGRRLTS